MPKVIRAYVRYVDALNWYFGRVAMYLIFAMIGVLGFSSISKSFFTPSLWTLEVAQFIMVAYFLLGGGYSMQMGSHVRMDLVYGRWSERTQAAVDTITILFLVFFLMGLLYGGIAIPATLSPFIAEITTISRIVPIASPPSIGPIQTWNIL